MSEKAYSLDVQTTVRHTEHSNADRLYFNQTIEIAGENLIDVARVQIRFQELADQIKAEAEAAELAAAFKPAPGQVWQDRDGDPWTVLSDGSLRFRGFGEEKPAQEAWDEWGPFHLAGADDGTMQSETFSSTPVQVKAAAVGTTSEPSDLLMSKIRESDPDVLQLWEDWAAGHRGIMFVDPPAFN